MNNSYLTNKVHLNHGLVFENTIAENMIMSYYNNLLKNLFDNCGKILVLLKKKTISAEVLSTIYKVQEKSVGKLIQEKKVIKGGHTTFPMNYFDNNYTGNYYESVEATESFGLDGYAKAGLTASIGFPVEQTNLVGGGANYYINLVKLTNDIKNIKTKEKIRITKDAEDMILLSIDLNLYSLFNEYIKKFKSKKITVKNLNSLVEKNSKFIHFVI